MTPSKGYGKASRFTSKHSVSWAITIFQCGAYHTIPYHTIPYRGKGAGEGGDLGLDTGNGVIMNGKKR